MSTEVIYGIVSTQLEIKNIENSIDAYMNTHYSDEKLPRIEKFFGRLLKDNQDVVSSYSSDEKASILFSASIPLVQTEISRSSSFKESCIPLEKKFSKIDIQPYLDKFVREYLWKMFHVLAESTIEPLLNSKNLKIDKRVEIPSDFKISSKAKMLLAE